MASNKVIGADNVVIWIQEDKGSGFIPYAVGSDAAGFTGLSIPGISTSDVFSTDRFGRPLLVKKNKEAPSGSPSASLSIYEQGSLDLIREHVDSGCPINIHSRIIKCGSLTNPTGWETIDLWSGGVFEDLTGADKPLGFDGTELTTEGSITFDSVLRIVQLSLVNYVTTETENVLSVDGIEDVVCGGCTSGAYKGANQHMFAGTSAAGGLTANVLFTNNGGGTWTEITADPFAADEDIDFIQVSFIGSDSFRVVVGTGTTDVAAEAKFAFSDILIGDEVNATWTTVLISAGATGDVIEALEQVSFDRGYIGSAGDIYVSTDGFTNDPGAPIYVGSAQINAITASTDESQVWAVGATNTILLETDGNDTFVSKVGPSGGGDFTAITIAEDGLLYAGNGQSLYLSVDEAGVVGNWSVLKDFGVNKQVISIECVKNESQLLRVVVNDSVAGEGTVFQSVDGGSTFTQYTLLANSGYNDSYFGTTDANRMTIVGDTHSALGLIQGLLP